MRTIRLQTHVDRDHTLRIELPPDVEEGPAEVIVLVPDRINPETIEEILPLAETVETPDLETIAHEIDDLYREIRRLVEQGARNPNRQQAIRSLRKRLRELQEQRAAVERQLITPSPAASNRRSPENSAGGGRIGIGNLKQR